MGSNTRKNSTGRPLTYNAKLHPNVVGLLAQLGWTDEEMSDFMGIGVSTFNEWKNAFPAFSEALTRAKLEPNKALEGRLYQLAFGFSHETEKMLPSGQVVTVTEHFAPDFKAMAYYLGNRDSKKWKNRQEVGFSDPDGNPTKLVIEIVDPKKDVE